MPRWIHKTDAERFWEKVDIQGDDDCWSWIAGKHSDGYGVFSSVMTGEWRCYLSHRFAYFLTFGKFPPDELELCHSCDHVWCVNPNHLFVGTHSDNIRDMMMKGRNHSHVGTMNPKTHLCDDDVIQIREFYDGGSYPAKLLGVLFGISSTQIMNIVHRGSWNHIP